MTLETVQHFIEGLNFPSLLSAGLITLIGYYCGKSMKYIRLPSIIGFMLIGVLLGPSLINLLNQNVQNNLSFITDIALSFVALSIGLELKLSNLCRFGFGIILIIIAESFLAFACVSIGLYLFTGNLVLAILFGAIAPASAPAGTVAVIQEYKAKGPLTNALYCVVGFDDGLGIIIFGFVFVIAKGLLPNSTNNDFWVLLIEPLWEIGGSIILGAILSLLYSLLTRKLTSKRDIFILTFAFVLITTGICNIFNFSLILTNMVLGLIVVNIKDNQYIERVKDELSNVMPLLFILFFVLAGSNLHIIVLPSLGIIGIVYIICRSMGLIGGAALGAIIGRSDPKLRKYLGLGILSQAGVAIGLSLIVKQEFSLLGAEAMEIGTAVITTITATSIFFEIIGPILTKIALKKAGEISIQKRIKH